MIHHSVLHTTQGIRKVKLDTMQEACERQEAIPSSAQHILLIDDSPTVRNVIETALVQRGYETRAFSDGIKAMQWLSRPDAWVPDLMMVDLGLPKIDGYEVIQRIKTKPAFARTRCMILSRRDGTIDKLKGRLAGAAMYLAKPFTTQELLTAVHSILTDKYGHNGTALHNSTYSAYSVTKARNPGI
ncbi:MAG TPA: response regulator transcription factor [Ktedonobacteraceae bacterium]